MWFYTLVTKRYTGGPCTKLSAFWQQCQRSSNQKADSYLPGNQLTGRDLLFHQRYQDNYHADFRLLLLSQRSRLCLDPRDKAYSILSIIQQQNIQREITPDYTCDFVWLYCHATSLDIISRGGDINILRESMTKSSASRFPSWCSDWSSPRSYSQIESGYHTTDSNSAKCSVLPRSAIVDNTVVHTARLYQKIEYRKPMKNLNGAKMVTDPAVGNFFR
jgi:hypothetical protein